MTPEDKYKGGDPDGRKSLRTAIIVFAIVEAVIIAAVIFYKTTR
jgi:hypothetical protein